MKALSYMETETAQKNASARAGNDSLLFAVKRCADEFRSSSALDAKALEQARNKVSTLIFRQKLAAAMDDNTPVETLAVLAEDKDSRIHENVSRNKNTSAQTLAALAKKSNYIVRAGVAANKNTPIEVLRVLSEDDSFTVRRSLAENTKTSGEMLNTLAKDKDSLVRAGVAANKNTPAEALTALAEDKDYWVCANVAKNTATEPKTLVALSQKHDDDDIVSLLAQRNPSLPLSRILELAHHRHYYQRIRVVDNPSLPYENLLLMLGDRSKKVREKAEEVLRKRNGSVRVGWDYGIKDSR